MFNFVDNLTKKYEPEPKSVLPVQDKGIAEALARLGVETGLDITGDQFGDQRSVNSIYGNIVWAYRSIGFIASNLARVPWKFKKGDDDVTDKIVLNPFENPNPLQSRYDFLVESLSRLELQGEMFWELDRRSALGDQILAMYADWRSEEVTVIPDTKYKVKGYERMLNGKKLEFTPDEVFHVKYFNPTNPLRGMGPLSPARHAADTDLNATFYNKQFFKQGARPAGIVSTDAILPSTEVSRLEEQIKKRYQSVDQMHELLILWGGLKFVPLNTMSMTDMQFKDLKMMNREEIIVAFGLSLEVLGLGQKTYENVQYFRRLAWTEKLIPLLDKFLSLINKNIVEDVYQMEGVIVEADYGDIDALREERGKKMIDFDKGFKTAAVTPNEIREEVFGMDPLPDPKMDMTYLPAVGPSGQPSTSTDGNPPPEPPKFYTPIASKALSYDARTKIWHMKIKQFSKFEPIFQTFVSGIFNEINKDIKSKVGLLLGKSLKIEDEGGVTIPPSAAMRARKFFDIEYWKKRLADESRPIIGAVMKDAADTILSGENLLFDPVHPFVRGLIGQRTNQFSEFVSMTTDKDLQKLIMETLQQTADLGIDAQARALQLVFDEYNVVAKKNRASLIARTETMGASNAGTMAGMVQGGFERKMWITSRDPKVRDSHQIDGQVRNVNEDFTMADGVSTPFPQDYNERCIHIPTLEPRN